MRIFWRICMYSNPQAKPGYDTRIRMGFLRLDDMCLLNSNYKTVLGSENLSYDNFDIIIDNEPGKIQRMFDVAISEPENPKVLYCTFSNEKDSRYMLYSNGRKQFICNGGLSFWRPKYQGGASFLDSSTIVLSREKDGFDHIESYKITIKGIKAHKVFLKESTGKDTTHRNIRPISDINSRKFIWQSGYYDFTTYENFKMNVRFK